MQTISLPETSAGIRGMTVAPATHLLFLSYGGDGGGSGNGSVMAYDLVNENPSGRSNLSTGVDSGAVSPDARRLYMQTGENSTNGIWNILDITNGAVIGTIQGERAPTTRSPQATGAMSTSEDATTTSWTSTTRHPAMSAKWDRSSTACDRSPAVHKEVQVYDVSMVFQGVAPTQFGVIPVAGLSVSRRENPCAYDCGPDGWLQHSLDGRFVYVGDSGEVLNTATRTVLTTLPTLANTRKSLEIDWAAGVPVATSGRTAVAT